MLWHKLCVRKVLMTFLLLYEVGALALFVTHRTNGLLDQYIVSYKTDGNRSLW